MMTDLTPEKLAELKARHEARKASWQSYGVLHPLDAGSAVDDIDTLIAEVERLRVKLEVHDNGYDGIDGRNETIKEQAALIEHLKLKAERLAEALRPFGDDDDETWWDSTFSLGQLRAARKALAEYKR